LENAVAFRDTAAQLRVTHRPPPANLPEHASTLVWCNLPQIFEVSAGKLNESVDETSRYRNIETKDHVPDYLAVLMPKGVNAEVHAPRRVILTRGFGQILCYNTNVRLRY
jgi:hypothetical protein